MFKTLGEKKRQLDNLISVANGIKDLELHIDGKYCDFLINSKFEIIDLCFSETINYNVLVEDIENSINLGIKKMQHLINQKTQEILNYKH